MPFVAISLTPSFRKGLGHSGRSASATLSKGFPLPATAAHDGAQKAHIPHRTFACDGAPPGSRCTYIPDPDVSGRPRTLRTRGPSETFHAPASAPQPNARTRP